MSLPQRATRQTTDPVGEGIELAALVEMKTAELRTLQTEKGSAMGTDEMQALGEGVVALLRQGWSRLPEWKRSAGNPGKLRFWALQEGEGRIEDGAVLGEDGRVYRLDRSARRRGEFWVLVAQLLGLTLLGGLFVTHTKETMDLLSGLQGWDYFWSIGAVAAGRLLWMPGSSSLWNFLLPGAEIRELTPGLGDEADERLLGEAQARMGKAALQGMEAMQVQRVREESDAQVGRIALQQLGALA